MPIVRTRKEAAQLLGVEDRTLANWSKEPWWPADATQQTPRGQRFNWNTDRISAARDAAGRKGSETADEAKRLRLAREREKLEQDRIATQHEQLKFDAAAGKVIPRAAEELFASTLLTELGDWCDQVPALIANTLPKQYRKKLSDRLKQELDDRRIALRETLVARARELDKQTYGAPPK
jgi:hypothetical protein